MDVSVPAGGDIQVAINQVAAAGGGNVNLDSGTWTLVSSLQMKSFVSLNGAGTNTVLQGPLNVYNYPLIGDGGVEPLTNLTVQNLVLDCRLPSGAHITDVNGYGPYENVLGILFAAYTYNHQNITVSGVEVKNAGMGLHVKGTTGLMITNCYLHDNGISYWGSHNMYLRRDNNVVVTHTTMSYSHQGVGLHIAGGGNNWLVEKCSFVGNNGYGVNIQDKPSNCRFVDCYAAFNAGNGADLSGTNNTTIIRNRFEYNSGYGLHTTYGLGTNNCITNNFGFFNNGGNFNIHGTYFQTNNLSAKTANVWEAELAVGATGMPDTADWVTTNSDYNLVGAVDFQNHLSDGTLLWPDVSVAAAATYPVRFRYANGSGATQFMQLVVNGVVVAPSLAFPPTAGWNTWAFVTNNTALTSGNNNVQVSVTGSGAPTLDYLQFIASAPALPAAPTALVATTVSYRQINLNWNASAGAASYSVKRSVASGGPYQVIAAGVTTTNFSDANIVFGGQTNYYVVSAANAAGESANSSEAFAVTTVAAPGGFSLTPSFAGNELQWIGTFGATGFRVKRATTSGGPYAVVANLANTADIASANNFYMNFADTTVSNGVTYFYVLTATNALSESNPSYEMFATSVVAPVSYYTNSIGYWQTAANWTNEPIAAGNNLAFNSVASVSTNDFPNGTIFSSVSFANNSATVCGLNGSSSYSLGDISSSANVTLTNMSLFFHTNAIVTSSAGTLIFATGISNGSGRTVEMRAQGGAINFTKGITNNGTLHLIHSAQQNLSVPLTGTGTVEKSGAGMLDFLAGTAGSTCALIIDGDAASNTRAQADAANAFASMASVTFNDNAPGLFGSGGRTVYGHNVAVSFPSLIISDGSTNLILQSNAGTGTYGGTWTGGGSLLIANGFGPTFNLAANMTNFTGTLVCSDGGGSSDLFNLQNTSAVGLPNATVWLWNDQGANSAASCTLQWNPSTSTSAVIPIGALWSTNSNAGTTNYLSNGKSGTTATYQIGGVDADSSFGGIIQNGSGTTALRKVGAGTLELTAPNTFTGGTVISNGVLLVNNTVGSGTGSGLVTVASGATLEGNGFISGSVTVQSGGTLAPGNALGTLTVNSVVTLQSGSVCWIEINRTNAQTSDKLVANSIATSGTLVVTNIGSSDFAGGDVFTLFNSAVSGFSSVTLPALPLGRFWNNRLAVDGTLVIGAVNLTPTNIVATRLGNGLQLAWPADHTGWRLQVQTNSLAAGLGTNWSDVSGSAGTNQMTVNILMTNAAVLYRLVYP